MKVLKTVLTTPMTGLFELSALQVDSIFKGNTEKLVSNKSTPISGQKYSEMKKSVTHKFPCHFGNQWLCLNEKKFV